jgi:hypothetical protein
MSPKLSYQKRGTTRFLRSGFFAIRVDLFEFRFRR